MQFLIKKENLLIAGIIVLFFMLFFANTKAPLAIKNKLDTTSNQISFEKIIDEAKLSLPSDKKDIVIRIENQLNKADNFQTVILLDSLLKITLTLKERILTAYYTELLALKKQTPIIWLNAGNRFYTATTFAKEEYKPLLYKKAITCFVRLLAIDSTNITAKVNLAVCYVESSNDPMQGISILKDVIKKDSLNVNAPFNLGVFAIQSGQYDKAITHFSRVLKIDSTYFEAYLYMAQAYENTGNKTKAIALLTQYASFVNDITIKTEVQNYINKLQTN